MNRADRPATGGDGQDGEDPASDARPPRGALSWAAAGAVAAAQVAIVVGIGGHWRTAGAVLLAVVTLAVVGLAMAGRRR